MAMFKREHKNLSGGRLHLLAKCHDYPCNRVNNSDIVAEITITAGHVKCSCGQISPHVSSKEEGKTWMNMHLNNPDNGEIDIRTLRGARYGTAGKSLSSSSAKEVFGNSVEAGAVGERVLAAKLAHSSETRAYDHWQSLSIPAKPGQKRYRGDVDFVVANGNRIILVDAKQWSANHVYWSFAGMLFKDMGFMKNKDGSQQKISRNMELAVNRYREAIPGAIVSGIVVFVPSSAGFPTSVSFLRWPGGIKSYFPNDGIRKIAKLLGPRVETENKIFTKLNSLIQR